MRRFLTPAGETFRALVEKTEVSRPKFFSVLPQKVGMCLLLLQRNVAFRLLFLNYIQVPREEVSERSRRVPSIC